MDEGNFKKIWLTLTVIAVAVILLLAARAGYNSGKAEAQSELVWKNAEGLTEGLEYFYQDQDRYPTALEYQNTEIMGQYFFPFPPVEFPGAACLNSFVYRRPGPAEFQLSYCLEKDTGGKKAGWHRLEGMANRY